MKYLVYVRGNMFAFHQLVSYILAEADVKKTFSKNNAKSLE